MRERSSQQRAVPALVRRSVVQEPTSEEAPGLDRFLFMQLLISQTHLNRI